MKSLDISLRLNLTEEVREHEIGNIIQNVSDGLIEYDHYTGISDRLAIDEVIISEGKFFPSGFASWIETYHEITSFLDRNLYNEDSTISKIFSKEGKRAIYNMAEDLTDKFEIEHQGYNWDMNDFQDCFDDFINKQKLIIKK